MRTTTMDKMSRRQGFTVIELLVVVLIIGILALLAVPKYTKSVETSDASDAVSTLQTIATTNRLYNLNQGSYTKGDISSCTNASCGALTGATDPCNLPCSQYLAMQNFGQSRYSFCTMDGATKQADQCGLGAAAANYVACTARKVCGTAPTCGGAVPATSCTKSSPYKSWGYTVDVNGVIKPWPAANPPPDPPS